MRSLRPVIAVLVGLVLASACGGTEVARVDDAPTHEVATAAPDTATVMQVPPTPDTAASDDAPVVAPPTPGPSCPPDRGLPTAVLTATMLDEPSTYRLDASIVNLGMASVQLRSGAGTDGAAIGEYLNGVFTASPTPYAGIEVVAFEGTADAYTATLRVTDGATHDVSAYVRGEAGLLHEFQGGCDYVWSWSSASSDTVTLG